MVEDRLGKNILHKRRCGNFEEYVSKDDGIVCAVGSLGGGGGKID